MERSVPLLPDKKPFHYQVSNRVPVDGLQSLPFGKVGGVVGMSGGGPVPSV